MKTLKEIANELQIEIKNKKKDLAIVECDQIMNDLTIDDLVCWTNHHPVSKYYYLNVAPRVPFRQEGIKIMSKCLGNVDKLDDREILAKKRESIIFFKNNWAEMRKDFEILKNIS
jgi:hypothetical protein